MHGILQHITLAHQGLRHSLLIIAVLCGPGNASQQELDALHQQSSRCMDLAVPVKGGQAVEGVFEAQVQNC